MPLAALVAGRRRARAARAAVGLPDGRGSISVPAAAIVVLGVLCGAAAAQPTIRTVGHASVRTDAAAYVVMDTSRSMLAAGAPATPTRMDRARTIARRIRARLDSVPVGVLSLSDRLLPHLFPSPDGDAFDRVVSGPVRGGHPSPAGGLGATSSLSALVTIGDKTLFPAAATRRAIVVVTDAESSVLERRALSAAFAGPPRIALAVVRVGNEGELVFDPAGVPERGYRPQPSAPQRAAALAETGEGRLFGERDADAAADWVASRLGTSGHTAEAGLVVTRRDLAPWLLALAALPLGLLVWLRNVPHGRAEGLFPATLRAARRRSSVG